MANMYGGDFSSYFDTMGGFFSGFESWEEMLPGEGGELISDTLKSQYDVIYGAWPENYDEVVLIVDKNNEVSDLVLYTLGLRTEEGAHRIPRGLPRRRGGGYDRRELEL